MGKKSENKMTLDFTYLLQPPKRYTFQQPKLKQWVEKWCKGKTLNLFCGMIKLEIPYTQICVDIDTNMPADYHQDAFEFVSNYRGEKFDTIVLDPPYSLRKSREKYGGRYIGSFTKIKNKLPDILKENGRIITLGYDSVGMAKCRGFTKIALCLVCHSGDHDDTVGVVEEKDTIALVETKNKEATQQ